MEVDNKKNDENIIPNDADKPQKGVNVPNLRFKEYCKNWTIEPMENVCKFFKGRGISKEDLSDTGNPCILYGELYTTYKTAIAKTIKSRTLLDLKSLVHSKSNDVLIPCSGETAEDISTSICIPYDDVLIGGDLTIIRSQLNGAFLDIKEYSINFVATDTRRLAIVKYDTQGINTLSLIIPKRAMNEIQKLFVDNIEIFFNATYIIIKSPTYLFFSKVINAKYPDYEKIIPKSFKNTLKLPKDKFIESIKIVSSLSSKIKITLNANEILFESISDRNHKASTQIDIQTGIQEEFTFGVDSKNITDFLAQVDSAEFTMALNEQNSPL